MKQGRATVAISSVLLLLVSTCLAVNPGFRTSFTTKGLDYIRQVGIPLLEQRLSSINIPDVSGHSDIHIGFIKTGVDYWLTNIQLSDLQIPTSSLSSGSSGLTVRTSGISICVSADWRYKQTSWPHVKDHGTCDVSVSEVSLDVSVKVGVDTKGHGTLSTDGCSFNVGHLSVKFHGGASWIYNLFDHSIADKIKDQLQSQICKEATNAINTAGSKALESLPVVIQLDKFSEINYALLKAPEFTSTYVETQHKGEFYSVTDPVEAPLTPPPLPPVSDANKMMYVWITDYVAKTASLVYQKAGVLQYTITPKMLPPQIPFHLDTDFFRLLIPQFYNKYPDMPVMLHLKSTKPPTLEILPSSVDFTVVGQVDVYVMNPNKTSTAKLAFTIGIVLHCNVDPWVSTNGTKEVLKANTTFVSVDLSLVDTNIGNFSVARLQTTANLLSKAFIIPMFNRYGNIGLPLPMIDGISFTDTAVKLGKGYVLIGTDFKYKAPIPA